MGDEKIRQFQRVEMELESENVVAIGPARREVRIARAAGSRIVFVSDTYLPRQFVEAELRHHGFAMDGDGIYVSSEIKKRKRTGRLFKHLLLTEDIRPHQIVHTGDDELSDVRVPRRLGIKCKLAARYSSDRMSKGDSDVGGVDYLARSKIVGAMRNHRVTRKAASAEEGFEAFTDCIGPLLLGFVSWVLSQAQRAGIERLYFLSRDCQMACAVCDVLSKRFGGIECRYLYVSRQALYLPSAEGILAESMPWMRRNFESSTLERLLAMLEVTYDDVRRQWETTARTAEGSYVLKSEADRALFWRALNQEPLQGQILERIVQRRSGAEKYFRCAGLFDQKRWAVVDLGWSLYCQSVLKRILIRAGHHGECIGYYLGLRSDRLGPAEAGHASAMFYQRVQTGAKIPFQALYCLSMSWDSLTIPVCTTTISPGGREFLSLEKRR